MRPSRQKLALSALFALAGTMAMVSQYHPAFQMIHAQEDGLPIRDLVLPGQSSAFADQWTLTLQLHTLPEAIDIIKAPQTVTSALEKVVSLVSFTLPPLI